MGVGDYWWLYAAGIDIDGCRRLLVAIDSYWW